MSSRKIVPATALALAAMTVLGWSAMTPSTAHVETIASLAPVLALTAQHADSTDRSRITPASGHRVATVPDKDGGTP
ncbi:hypothetical protein [Streptomyces cavernicola]|uniref:Secreted protein n=1 Tax=Streptomyces cavernicola TaxID=3043613 RepID=A0ABT6SJK4_9ACTN|nr:hypothetical protein [Streptomyces sp. B-S-A6]MDI3408378.1 hypothetical protein [Streptomyces sp. B-S-A6]